MGCMRFQQSWNRNNNNNNTPPILKIDQVSQECQSNLIQILRYAILQLGINHIETAGVYGSSELQLGEALGTLFRCGELKRENVIIQTKSILDGKDMTVMEYKHRINMSLKRLQLTYIDLFSIHAVNSSDQIDWLFHGDEKLIDAVKELKSEGTIHHVGFSSHASPDVIGRLIESDEFDYVNLHYHFIGSYTSLSSSSEEEGNHGNLVNIIKAYERDMGVFIISPYDKGGKLYAPSNKLRELTLPHAEPMAYASWWLWQQHHQQHQHQQHHQLSNMMTKNKNRPYIHTIVCGAARPSDFDQPMLAALKMKRDPDHIRDICQTISSRIHHVMMDELGEEWMNHWHVGIPDAMHTRYGTQIMGVIWLFNLIQTFGLLDYARDRYEVWESRLEKWDRGLTTEENVRLLFGRFWYVVPGCALEEGCDYEKDLVGCLDDEKRQKVLEVLEFVRIWCGKNTRDGLEVPFGWENAYDMRPWTAFPER